MFEWPKKKLGFGLMRLPLTDPEDQGSIDLEQMKKMVDIFMSKGFTYFDTAWMYCAFKSEEAVKPALTDRYPRESFTLTTKLNSHFFNSREDMENVFNTQLKKTGAGYFDFYFLRSMVRALPSTRSSNALTGCWRKRLQAWCAISVFPTMTKPMFWTRS